MWSYIRWNMEWTQNWRFGKRTIKLPEGYEGKDVDLSKRKELDEIYEFLKSNYCWKWWSDAKNFLKMQLNGLYLSFLRIELKIKKNDRFYSLSSNQNSYSWDWYNFNWGWFFLWEKGI